MRRPRQEAFERGGTTVRCEPKGERPGTDMPPRSAGEPTVTRKRASLCMRVVFCICLTFDLSGPPKAGPLEGRVRPHCMPVRDVLH
jgi:hypothetical protein